MNSIYQAMYTCKLIQSIGLPGYNDITLGLLVGSGNSDIVIKGTIARFVVGKEYLINVAEIP